MKNIFSAITLCLLFALKAYPFTQIVTVQDHVFTPSSFTINIGDTIKWTWLNGSHTTTSLTIPAGATTWDHPINLSSTSFIYVPSKTGVYNYKCTPHFAIGMQGSFTVVCPNASAQISAGSATTFCKGGSVLFSSTVSASITSYQWTKNGTNIVNATASSYSATATGSYAVSVTNSCGNSATSNAIKVTVNPLPVATVTPADTVFICKGDSVKLQASIAASETYQWQKNGVNITAATASSYTAKTGGKYRVVITKTTTGCSKTSAVTRVIIQCPAANNPVTQSDIDAIKIYPNPSSHDFHVSIPSYNDQYSLLIFDGTGNPVGNSKINSTEFLFGGELKPGIYLIQIKKGSQVVHEEKLVKE